MGITYYSHKEGIALLVKLLNDEKLTAILGAGFTKNCRAKRDAVPDGDKAAEIMKQLIRKNRKINLDDMDFNKVSDRFFSIVPKKQQWDFFESYFTSVYLPEHLKEFLNLPWPYLYTINIDDAIERTGLYTPIMPYHNVNQKRNSLRTVYKLHGDASCEVKYRMENNIIFSSTQYIDSLISDSNRTILNAVCADYRQKNIVYIGCSLKNEPDLKYIYSRVKEDISSHILRCVIRMEKPNENEKLDLEEYGINSVIIVDDFELFYREFVDEYKSLNAQEYSENYKYINPQIIPLDENKKDDNIKYFSGKSIFSIDDNAFYKSRLQIMRSCMTEIETCIEKNSSVIIQGRRFSGKTHVLSSIAERYNKDAIYYFPSQIMIDEDVILNLLQNRTNSVFLFDSNCLTDYSYHQVAHCEQLLRKNKNKIVVAINSNDIYLSDTLNAEIIRIPSVFDFEELKKFNPVCDKFGLIKRGKRETNIDYLTLLKNQQKLDLSLFNKIPCTFRDSEIVLLLMLCVKDKLFFSDISALNIKYRDVDIFITRLAGLVEKIPVSKGEKKSHSSEKIVHNSKYYLLSIVQTLKDDEVISAIRFIVSKLHTDSSRKRLYIDVVLFDTLNQLFGRSTGAGKLITNIYDALEPFLNNDMDYWLQRSKSIYRIYPQEYDKLKISYQYAQKATHDGDERLKAKGALSVSLICCLISCICKDEKEKSDYELEAIENSYMAITSSYFTKYNGVLKNEVTRKRDSYYNLIIKICRKHSEPVESCDIAWKSAKIIKILSELVE